MRIELMKKEQEPITEIELIIPALKEIKEAGKDGISMSQLRPKIEHTVKPSGEDTDILKNRNDNKASQKIRNLTSHRTLVKNGYAEYNTETKKYTITEKGQKYLKQVQ